MSGNSRRRVIASLLAGLSASIVVLAGCSSGVEGGIDAGMGDATSVPAASPAAPDIAIGKAKKIDEDTTDTVFVGDRVVLKARDKIFVGPLNSLIERSMKLDAKCGELVPGGPNALLPCEDGIHIITDQATETAVAGHGTGYSAAVGLEGGRIIDAYADSNVVDVFGVDGELASDFKAANNGSQLVEILRAGSDADAKLLEVNRSETSVYELKLDESRAGSALHVGIGVGKVASGDHVIAAADTKGNQLLIYTATNIIRLHQAVPTLEAPWAVAVDESRRIVWVTSTKVNKLTGYDISSGTPVKVADINAVADSQSVVAIGDDQIGIFLTTGDGAQIFGSADIDKAIADSKQDAEKIREEISVRESADKLLTGVGDTKGANDSEGETR